MKANATLSQKRVYSMWISVYKPYDINTCYHVDIHVSFFLEQIDAHKHTGGKQQQVEKNMPMRSNSTEMAISPDVQKCVNESTRWQNVVNLNGNAHVTSNESTSEKAKPLDGRPLFAFLGLIQNIPAAAQAFLQPGCWQKDKLWLHSERKLVSSCDM